MSWNSHAARGSPEGVCHSMSVVTDVTKLGFRPASSSGRAPALLSRDPLIPPHPSAFCLDRFASPGHSVRMQSSNLGALLAAGSREAANTTQEAPGDTAGGAGTLDPQPGLRDSCTCHPVPRGRFLSTSPGLGSGSGLGDAHGQGTRVPTRPRGPAQRGAVTARSGGGAVAGRRSFTSGHCGSPGRGPLARCPEVDPGPDGAPSVCTQPPPGQGDVTGALGLAGAGGRPLGQLSPGPCWGAGGPGPGLVGRGEGCIPCRSPALPSCCSRAVSTPGRPGSVHGPGRVGRLPRSSGTYRLLLPVIAEQGRAPGAAGPRVRAARGLGQAPPPPEIPGSSPNPGVLTVTDCPHPHPVPAQGSSWSPLTFPAFPCPLSR